MLSKCVLGAAAFAAIGVATWNWSIQPDTEQHRGFEASEDNVRVRNVPVAGLLGHIAKRGSQTEYVAVRIQLPAADGSLVPVWIDVLRAEGDVLTGVVSNCKEQLCGRKLGDPIRVNVSHVDDWMVIEQGKVLGAMTLAGN